MNLFNLCFFKPNGLPLSLIGLIAIKHWASIGDTNIRPAAAEMDGIKVLVIFTKLPIISANVEKGLLCATFQSLLSCRAVRVYFHSSAMQSRNAATTRVR